MAHYTMMGYGLTDVMEGDPRINWDSPLIDYDKCEEATIDNYLRYVNRDMAEGVDAFIKMWRAERPGIPTSEPFDAVRYGADDFGLKNVICIRPIGFRDWQRVDDVISDAYENVLGRYLQNTVDILTRQPYPFIGHWTDLRTGSDVRNSDAFEWTTMNIEWSRQKKARNMDQLNRSAVRIGFASHEDAVNNLVPRVPDQIRKIVNFGKLFTSDNTILQLRPILYRFLT